MLCDTHWHNHLLPSLLHLKFLMSLTGRNQQVIYTLIVHLHYGYLQDEPVHMTITCTILVSGIQEHHDTSGIARDSEAV